jgi:hypothetical protein
MPAHEGGDVPVNPAYNFRLAPEAIWLIVNTVLGALLTTLVTTDFTSITDWKAWAIGLGVSVVRTILGALLAAATGGSFLKPGEAPVNPTSG